MSFSVLATAATIPIDHYNMPNGGSAPGAVYWDSSYNGLGCNTCDGAALSFGTGELTDGLIEVSVFPGQGGTVPPWVGWNFDPTINLLFAQSWQFGTLRLHIMDGNGHAGITLPSQVRVSANGDDRTTILTDPGTDPEAAKWYDFDISGLSGTQLDVNITRGGVWLFIDEMEVLPRTPRSPALATFRKHIAHRLI